MHRFGLPPNLPDVRPNLPDSSPNLRGVRPPGVRRLRLVARGTESVRAAAGRIRRDHRRTAGRAPRPAADPDSELGEPPILPPV